MTIVTMINHRNYELAVFLNVTVLVVARVHAMQQQLYYPVVSIVV